MIEIEKPRIETTDLKPDGTYGKFIVEPLERGYGTTLGTACAASCSPRCRDMPLPPLKLTTFCTNSPRSPV